MASSYPLVLGILVKATAPLLSANKTTLLTENTQILKRMVEYFRCFLNQYTTISATNIDRLPQLETNANLSILPSLQETIRAVQQLSSETAPGSDAIPAKIYNHGGPKLMNQLTALFYAMWRQVQVPQDFKAATIVHLYKKKMNRQPPGNLAAQHRQENLRHQSPQSPQQPSGTRTSSGN
ncbi:unnamed protein product [Schistocephalus solidus]|uniref:Ciliary neurotrophic factor n=1 Tax=Schistocephalus solidus TaxID=70667 RepID=A0A183SSF7_SCHSO|nr:unnamed protein product [Schistocephalus solidus]